jgi:hypothetical protein
MTIGYIFLVQLVGINLLLFLFMITYYFEMIHHVRGTYIFLSSQNMIYLTNILVRVNYKIGKYNGNVQIIRLKTKSSFVKKKN